MTPRTLSVVTAAPPFATKPEDMARLPLVADWVELRVDLVPTTPEAHLKAWVEASPRPVLVTLRSVQQGGKFNGRPRVAAGILHGLAQLPGVAAVDAEADVLPHLADLPDGVEIIGSTHAVDPQPGDGSRASIWKLALPVEDAKGWQRAVRLHADTSDRPAFVLPYGVLGSTRGAFVDRSRSGLLFGAASADAPVVPGQPSLPALLDELRAGEVDTSADLFGLCGAPPAHSPSPAMHNAVFRAAGRNALYVPIEGLDPVAATALPVAGLSVTTPFKTAAYALADEHDEASRATGAVNTLVRRDGGWFGANTDVTGMLDGAGIPAPSDGKTAFVYGAGGFARAAVAALRRLGYDVRAGARNEQRGRAFADHAGVAWAGTRYAPQGSDRLVCNATVAGADGAPVEALADVDATQCCVVDAPYRTDGPTGFVAQALAQGGTNIVDGKRLLVAQAAHQARLFTPDLKSVDVRRVMDLALRPPRNLILVGTRAAGKTTVGRAVARRLGRPFVDLDDEIERRTGRSSATWIESDGWDAFRAEERRALERVVHRRGIVLATGGGVVETEANRALIARSGCVVFLNLHPTHAAARMERAPGHRPRFNSAMSLVEECGWVVHRRFDWWRECSHHIVDAEPPVGDVVDAVARAWFGEVGTTAR